MPSLLFKDAMIKMVKKPTKWSTYFLLLAFFQILLDLMLLIPCLVHDKRLYDIASNENYYDAFQYYTLAGDTFIYKAWKVFGECIMFIVFEIWRLWLVIDGVIHQNSRTIIASALFKFVSFGFTLTMIAESSIWMDLTSKMPMLLPKDDPLSAVPSDVFSDIHDLQLINRNLQIALSCTVFLLIPLIMFVAHKVTKDFGWDVYKKIGSSMEIKKMFLTVQWLSLCLKIDIFFEICSYVLYLIILAIEQAGIQNLDYNGFDSQEKLILAIVLLSVPSLVFARLSVSWESRELMCMFILFQCMIIGSTIFIGFNPKYGLLLTMWSAAILYLVCVIIAAIATIVVSILCFRNFGKGLKEHVYWRPFMKGNTRRQSATYDMTNPMSSIQALEARGDMQIDDEN